MDAPTYPRSTGSARGQARRRELLARVTDDLARNGLADFSLRRAARAAGTTHKVLLYHFAGADELLAEAVRALREQRVGRGLDAVSAAGVTLADRVLALWPVLTSGEGAVLDQAIGLALYDPHRHGELGQGASEQYLTTLVRLCPAGWTDRHKAEVANLVLATLRGLLITRATTDDPGAVQAGLDGLARALRREEGLAAK